MRKVREYLEIKDATIMGGPFLNFSGKERRFNAAGKRNFCVQIDDEEYAKQLTKDGWKVKALKPRDPDDETVYYLPVEVNYKFKPPIIVMEAGQKRTVLDEDTVGLLDTADILYADLIINPSFWNDPSTGKSGIKAYLKEGKFNVYASMFASDITGMEKEEPEDEPMPF